MLSQTVSSFRISSFRRIHMSDELVSLPVRQRHTTSFIRCASRILKNPSRSWLKLIYSAVLTILIVSRLIVCQPSKLSNVRSDPQDLLGQAIRARRLALKLSQEKLAEKAHLHWTYIGGIERGERNVSLLNILRIARALNVTPSDLLKEIS